MIGTDLHDDVLPDPHAYRAACLARPFGDVTVGGQTFRGIAEPPTPDLVLKACELVPGFTPTLSFLRRSPAGQVEPNDIHSDAMMGDLTAIYYVNPDPPVEDGTTFWFHQPTGLTSGAWTEPLQQDSQTRSRWARVGFVHGKFNRLLVFRSDLFHSRALVENYGQGDTARLIHVVFGTLGAK